MLQDVCNNGTPFRGILTICCGNFQQLLPIVKTGNVADVEHACIKNLFLWLRFRKFQLTQNMHLDEHGQSYAGFLIDIGEDNLKNNGDEIQLPDGNGFATETLMTVFNLCTNHLIIQLKYSLRNVS